MKEFKPLVLIAGFIIAIFLVFKGLRTEGRMGLLLMFIGLGIMLFELYLYNRSYKD